MRRLVIDRLLFVAVAFALLASASAFGAVALDRHATTASHATSASHHRGRPGAQNRRTATSHRKSRRARDDDNTSSKRGAHHQKKKKKKKHGKRHPKRTKTVKTPPASPLATPPATPAAPTASTAVLTSPIGSVLPIISSEPSEPVGSTEPTEPAPTPPHNTALPAISGTTTEGDTLTTTKGTWEGSPTSYAYQWQDCNTSGASCTNIGGATASTHKLTASDVKHTVRVVVTATNEGGSTPATSAATATIAAKTPRPATLKNTTLPAISGTTTEGDTLATTKGTWEGSPTSYAYQWQDCNTSGASCTNIGGATEATYKLTASDVGSTIRVVVTATNEGGSTPATSHATAKVTAAASPPPPAPTSTALPDIGGTTTEGETLKATTGTWEGSPTSYAYQWQDCNTSGTSCANISGATTSSHKLTASDTGHTIRVVVTATNTGGSTPATSNATAQVSEAVSPPPSPPTNTTLPDISGTTTEGDTLTATSGAWSGNPTVYAYQWQDCSTSGTSCTNISGATTSSHKLTTSDVGHTVRVVVTATNEGGSTPATSAATVTVAKAVTDAGCTTTIGSGLQAAIEKAAAGSTICLEAGNYGEIAVETTKSSPVTIEPANGVSQSQAVLGYTDVTTSSNLTFEGLTIAGANDGSESSPATHIHWIGDSFTSGLCIQTPTSANIDVLVEGSTFIDTSTPGCGNEGRVEVNGDNNNVSGTNGVVISHDLFETASPHGCTDGVNITGGASGTVIGPGDEFSGMEQGSCDPEHVDPIQFYGAEHTTVTGDYFHGNSDGIMSPDGNGSPMTVTDNVFDTDGEYPNQIVIGGGGGDVIEHNTFGNGASIRIGSVNVGPTAANETIKNNIITGELALTEGQSSSGWTIEYNLVEGATLGSHGIDGRPTYVGGGSEPSTWAGWELTSTSLGHDAASDGTDMGADYFGS
jgi:hypothetical protein